MALEMKSIQNYSMAYHVNTNLKSGLESGSGPKYCIQCFGIRHNVSDGLQIVKKIYENVSFLVFHRFLFLL